MSPTQLTALAEKVEGAEGASVELDMLIDAAIKGIVVTYPTGSGRVSGNGTKGQSALRGWVDPGQHRSNFSLYGVYPAYTDSIDAAVLLVPEGMDWSVGTQPELGDGQTAWGNVSPGTIAYSAAAEITREAATPALALTAACLRAQAALSSEMTI